MHRTLRAAVVLGSMAIPHVLPSQNPSPKADHKEAPVVFIQESTSLEQNERARLYLRPGFYPSVVIVVPNAGTTEEDLADAFKAIVHMHKKLKTKDVTGKPGTVLRSGLTSERKGRRMHDSEVQAYRGYLASLSKAPEADLPGIGKGRVITVTLPDW